ncbi:G-type lectin S-receptor-like serine/threonine-protein kinase At4g27290 [Chenopodium quinoa]|uniref:G-type lectin S-receptor-like serine/threonine-protein kinase At4g27290 n=1 Tax=Chenopodium quinoa TaxID=63459 RepID=UPI000B79036B|nr:G-type lectin S-receptor-like serine/threonine-protein kinase At4g27290 [Chenopodium quinoa]
MTTLYGIALLWSFLSLIITCIALDTITLGQSIRDNSSETLVSAGGDFELGFFPGTNEKRYVGIWFKKIPSPTVVWVANRETPILDFAGVLQVTNNSVLKLFNGSGGVLWSTNTTRLVKNPIAKILDNGNLVIRDQDDDNPDNILWRSFDYPIDTMLPEMKLGRDLVTGFDRFLTSWTSSEDPSPGSYTYKIDPHGYPQPFVFRNGSVELFQDGPWNGVWFSGTSMLPDDTLASFVFSNKEMYYTYTMSDIPTRRTLNIDGSIQRLNWNNNTGDWEPLYNKPNDRCDTYASCGLFGICNLANSIQCQCLKGFVPKSPKDWNNGVWSGGCVHNGLLNCSINNGFTKYSNVKLPDTRYSWYYTTMNLDEWKHRCFQNCSCTACANLNFIGRGSGCLLWFDTLMDLRAINGPGQDLYVRVSSNSSKDLLLMLFLKTFFFFIFSFQYNFLSLKHAGSTVGKKLCFGQSHNYSTNFFIFFISYLWSQETRESEQENRSNKKESELPIFAFGVVEKATNYFSPSNKLGEGGFGSVYKGLLNNGEEIAVKRLSKDSRQGINEFKNEALFIASLQHRNLVRLNGCCVEAEERILIYEYMPNRSLDHFIFDETNNSTLDWTKRFDVIKGIARGLLYLHEDSRLRIVHRDLKASNVLLDSEMNPKISDFGLARSFDGNEHEAMTVRVVGTYGYMPPEYTIGGVFSVKSDVYSFGVLVLEIISGKKNRGFKHSDHQHNLLGHTWMLFRDKKTLDIVEPSIRNPNYEYEMHRSIHLGLLCVQQNPEERPSMSFVTAMLSGDSQLPEPKEPGFYFQRNMPHNSVSSNAHSSSNNEITMTLISGR